MEKTSFQKELVDFKRRALDLKQGGRCLLQQFEEIRGSKDATPAVKRQLDMLFEACDFVCLVAQRAADMAGNSNTPPVDTS
jgi:hypothetical protein